MMIDRIARGLSALSAALASPFEAPMSYRELREATAPKGERRFVTDIRAFDPDGDLGEDVAQRDIGGYGAVFDSPTVICDYFREVIAPGAFAKAILECDVRALFNHDANYVLGRNVSKTLVLSEDEKGLLWRASPPDTSWARDLAVSIDRGDISGCSFSFNPIIEEWDYAGVMPTRTLIEVELYDVSVVTYPAYDDTSVALRTLQRSAPKTTIGPGLASRIARKKANLDRRAPSA